MKKDQANAIKKVVNKEKHYQTFYDSKRETFRILVNQYYDHHAGAEMDAITRKEIQKVLVILQNNEMRPRFEIEHKRYQGFINTINILFK